MSRSTRQIDHDARKAAIKSGTFQLSSGLGLSIFLGAAAPTSTVWAVGQMFVLVGVVVFGFALLADRADRDPSPGCPGGMDA